jgi:hypothetical protein
MLTTSSFTPITSIDDIRLVTLIAVAINVIEELALEQNTNPDSILSEQLFTTYKHINEQGSNCYLEKLSSHYPLLRQVIN